jgi:general secretion pathway protein A
VVGLFLIQAICQRAKLIPQICQSFMYLNFYVFNEKPFNLTPDPRFIYFSKTHRDSLDTVQQSISRREAIISLSGEVGTGKTTLIHALLEQLSPSIKVALISHTLLSARGLIKYICQAFSINCKSKNRPVLNATLEAFLTETYRKGEQALLIIDEAQNLKSEVLEQLISFANFRKNNTSLFQILLVGQPELVKKLAHPSNAKLANCIQTRCQLARLTLAETKEYIEHRILKAGFSPMGSLFPDETIEAIYEFTAGTPRLINILCDNALLMGFVLNSPRITAEIIKKVQFEDTFSEMESFNPVKVQTTDSITAPDPKVSESTHQIRTSAHNNPSLPLIIQNNPKSNFFNKIKHRLTAGFNWLEKWTSIPIEIFAVLGYALLLFLIFILLKIF